MRTLLQVPLSFLFLRLKQATLEVPRTQGPWQMSNPAGFPLVASMPQAATFFGHHQHVLEECQLIPTFVQGELRGVNLLPKIKMHSKVKY